MKIGIDCRSILNPERGEAGGVGHYVYQLIRHLLQIDQKNKYVLFFDHRTKQKKLQKFKQANVKISFFPFFLYSKFIIPSVSHHLFSAVIEKEKLDILHFPNSSQHPDKFNSKKILTIHDLSLLRLSNFFPTDQVKNGKRELEENVLLSDKIIAVSESTKKDLIDMFNVSSEKIKVIYHGLDKRFFKKTTPSEIDDVKKKYKIEKDYLLFLSPLEERKNIYRLIQAFNKVKKEIKDKSDKFNKVLIKNKDIQLVLTGKIKSASQKIKEEVKKSPYKNDIILTGYADPDDLNALFDGAKVFVFPSLYEGFGLPLIEAMSSKAPIITSNLSSMPEIVGKGNAIFVNPYRVEEIFRAFVDLLSNPDLREKLIKRASERVKIFTWEKTAHETLLAYQELVD